MKEKAFYRMLVKETHSLFYKKFPYKIILTGEWPLFSVRSISYIWPTLRKKQQEILNFLRSYPEDDMRFRMESYQVSVFFKDPTLPSELEKKWPGSVKEFYEPKNALATEKMLNNVRLEIRGNLIHGCRYRVKLKDSVWRKDPDSVLSLTRFKDFHDRNQEKFVLTPSLVVALRAGGNYWVSNCYFYVMDSKTLMMTQMYLHNVIKETIKMITHDELNEGKEIND